MLKADFAGEQLAVERYKDLVLACIPGDWATRGLFERLLVQE